MNTLHRYVFKQILQASLMSVGLFVFLIVAVNAQRDVSGLLASGQMSFQLFAELLLLLIPYAATYALPLGLLTAVLLVLGRLSAQGEITAMRSAGIGLFTIVAPIFLMAMAGIAFSLFVNFQYAPTARTAYKERLANVLRDNPRELIQPRTFVKQFPGWILYVGDREGRRLRDVWIWVLDEQQRVVETARAEHGRFHYERETDEIVLSLDSAFGEKRRGSDPERVMDVQTPVINFSQWQPRFPMEEFIGNTSIRRKLSMMTLAELLSMRSEALAAEAEGDEEAFEQRMAVQMQIQKHASLAFAILSLTSIAIPLGIKVSRSETYANLALALVLGLVYYLFVFLLAMLEKQLHLRPDLLIWIPNLLFQGLGLWWMARQSQ